VKITRNFWRPTLTAKNNVIFGDIFLTIKNILLFAPTTLKPLKLSWAIEKHSFSYRDGKNKL
jgi:hypothetical protein